MVSWAVLALNTSKTRMCLGEHFDHDFFLNPLTIWDLINYKLYLFYFSKFQAVQKIGEKCGQLWVKTKIVGVGGQNLFCLGQWKTQAQYY
jgi:hypothetical protein